MIVYRDGVVRVMCDGCFRLHPQTPYVDQVGLASVSQELWTRTTGLAEALASERTVGKAGAPGTLITHTQPVQPGHLCSGCSQSTTKDPS